jgi:hypothetical protein
MSFFQIRLKDEAERYNRATPANDVTLFSKPITDFTEKVTRLANSAANPSEYANQILARICPTVLPYELDTPAYFNVAGFNGRALTDDVMGVILTLATAWHRTSNFFVLTFPTSENRTHSY